MKPTSLFLLAAVATLPAAAGGAERALYLEPLEDAPVVARVPSDDPVLKAAVPVLETGDGGRARWLWTEYRGRFTVYVPDEAVSKNFELATGSAARLEAREDAPVLTRIEERDAFEVLSSESGWTRLRLTKTVPLYLKAPAAPAPAPAPGPVAAAAPPEIPRFNPELGVGTTDPSALPPENTVWTSAEQTPADSEPPPQAAPVPPKAPPAADLVVDPRSASPLRAPQDPETRPGASTRTLAGTLARSLPGALGGPRYPLRLNAQGRNHRIAYVDLSHLFIRDLRPYLGRSVQVTGEVRPLVPGSDELVIRARTIRIIE